MIHQSTTTTEAQQPILFLDMLTLAFSVAATDATYFPNDTAELYADQAVEIVVESWR
jgi:hypothetical protein